MTRTRTFVVKAMVVIGLGIGALVTAPPAAAGSMCETALICVEDCGGHDICATCPGTAYQRCEFKESCAGLAKWCEFEM